MTVTLPEEAERQAATIIISDGSPTALGLIARIESWTQAGLIKPSWWIDGQALDPSKSVPIDSPNRDTDRMQSVVATKIGLDATETVPLLDSLASIAYDTCRLVMVHLPTAADDVRVAIAKAARDFFDELGHYLPNINNVVKVNLVVPVSGLESVDPNILQHGWTVNLVVSPEDRVDDRHISTGITHPGNLISHAALNLAAVSGLWAGMTDGPFDQTAGSSNGDPDPITTRAFVRALRGGGVVHEIAADALMARSADGWDLPTDDALIFGSERPVVARNPLTLIEQLLESAAALDNGGLRFTPATQVPVVAKTRLGIIQTFLLPFRLYGAALRGAPEAAVSQLKQSVTELLEDKASEFTFGSESLFVARFRGEPASRDVEKADFLERSTDEAERTLTLLGAQTSVGPTPGLWQALRRFCFGIVDGSSLPSELSVPQVGSRKQLITSPEIIVADPDDDYFELPPYLAPGGDLAKWAGFRILPTDVFHATLIEADLKFAAMKAAAPAPPVAGSGSEPIVLATQSQDIEELAQETERLREWLAPREGSFLWQLGRRISDEITSAVAVTNQASPIVSRGWDEIDFEEPTRRGRRLHKHWIITAVVAVGAIAAGMSWHMTRPYRTIGVPVVLFVAFLVSFGTFRRYMKAMNRWEAHAQRTIRDYKQAVMNLYQSCVETIRLRAVYEQFVDWAEIIGWVLHHPWADLEPTDSAPAVSWVDEARALAVTDTLPSPAHISRLGQKSREKLIHVGWLSEIFADVAEVLGAEAAIGRTNADVFLSLADNDTPYQPNGKRKLLLESLRSKAPQKLARDKALFDIATFCGSLSPSEMFHDVQIPNREANESVSVDGFLSLAMPVEGAQSFDLRLWIDEAQVQNAASVAQSNLWVMADATSDRSKIDLQLTQPSIDGDGSYVVQAIRIDSSSRRPSSSYVMFGVDEVQVEQPFLYDSDDDDE